MIIQFMQNLARELSVGVTARLYYYGGLENKELGTTKLSRPEKNDVFLTQVQKDKLGVCLFAGSLGELQQVSTSLP